MTRSLRTGLLAIALLGLGAGGGYLAAGRLGAGTSSDDGSAADERWHTCGMHPDVLQKGPGECPICHMRLTPLGTDEGKGGEPKKKPSGPKEREILYWRAPMDSSYVSDRPGKSPMGMDLVPVYAGPDGAGSAGPGAIRIDPATVQHMGVRTEVLRRGPLVKTIRTVGRVDYDEQKVTFVDTKFNGWIETLSVNETGQAVQKGQRLFEVYSPELYAAQEEYLAAVRSLPLLERSSMESAREDARRLVEAAATKLRYLDVTGEQVEEIRRTGKAQKTLAVHSPADGIVTEKMALAGMYVKPGMRLYTIADLSRVWVLVDVYEYQLPWVRMGQPAEMSLSYLPARRFEGKVVYVYPYLDARTRVVKVRLEFPNEGLALKPGMFASVTLRAELSRSALLVPREAYIDSGTRKVAFIAKGGGRFEPREIETGVEAEDGLVEVVSGLEAGDVVVTSGQFLLDAESKLKEAIAKMMDPSRAEPREPDAHPASRVPADARFTCPMDTHEGADDPEDRGPFFSSEPGACPVCGMDLEPIERFEWVKALRAADGREIAYGCPDHPSVVGPERGGRCPTCGRALEPFLVGYTCPKREHAAETSEAKGRCGRCGAPLAPFLVRWLAGALAQAAPEGAGPASPAAAPGPSGASAPHVCPMHPQVTGGAGETCRVCGMQLIPEAAHTEPEAPPQRVAAQMGFLLEHYLALGRRLASDRTDEVALHALGAAAAAEALSGAARLLDAAHAGEVAEAAARARSAALAMRGQTLEADRVPFAELSGAVVRLVGIVRPDRARWPALVILRCPVSKGVWLQTDEEVRNPFYGFKNLRCGEVVGPPR